MKIVQKNNKKKATLKKHQETVETTHRSEENIQGSPNVIVRKELQSKQTNSWTKRLNDNILSFIMETHHFSFSEKTKFSINSQ